MPYLLTIEMPMTGDCCREAFAPVLEFEPEQRQAQLDERAFLLTITGDEFLSRGEFLLK